MAGASSKWRKALASSAVVALALLGLACGQADPFPAPNGEGGSITNTGPRPGTNGYGTKPMSGPCAVENEVRECHVLIGQHAGITNCFNGIQECKYGVWGVCKEGVITVKAAVGDADELVDQETLEEVAGGKLSDNEIHPAPPTQILLDEDRPLAQPLTTFGSCDDPCDPTCQRIIENIPYTSTGMALTAWATVASASLPNRKAAFTTPPSTLWVEPCAIDADCQFGMQCMNPVTRNLGAGAGQCAHDKCALGNAMSATCGDPCIAKVCAANPDCCTYAGACAPHAPCVTGVALTCQASDPAVAAVCDVLNNPSFAYCCTTTWDAACVTEYGNKKGVPCPSNPNRAWTSPGSDPAIGALGMTCTQLVHDACGVNCSNSAPACEHDPCSTGAGLTSGCDGGTGNCVQKVCMANSACCGPSGTWSQACIDAIPAACGTACPTTGGRCRLFLPNEVDPECAGADLIAATPCFDGNAFIPPGHYGQTCSTNSNCVANVPSGTTCQSGTCKKSCSTDSDCTVPSGGIICDAGVCKAGCHGTGAACPGIYACTSTTSAYGECRQFKVPGNSTPRSYAVICNLGTQPTPGGVPIAINVYGGNATVPLAWPAAPPANGAPTRTCSTAAIGSPSLLPGKCIDLPCVIDQYDQVYVNPPNPVAPYAGTAQIAECHNALGNNWAMNIDGTVRSACDAPLCSLQNGTIRSLKQHIVIEVENSSSMALNTWNGVRSGLINYLATNLGNPWTVADVNAAVGYYPDGGTDCLGAGAGACGAPPACIRWSMQPIGFFSVLVNAWLAFIVQPAVAEPPPHYTALKGALEHARADAATMVPGTTGSEWNESVIFAMGSDPTTPGNSYCGSTVVAMSGLAAEYYAKYGIRTSVIAVGAAQLSTAKAIAAAGGGNAFYVPNDANTANNFEAALANATAFSDQSCSFTLPPISLFDISGTKVTINAPSGPLGKYRYNTPTEAAQVTPVPGWSGSFPTYLEACLANCPSLPGTAPTPPATTTGWCFDDPTTPTKIVLCQDTCRASLFDPWQSLTASGVAHSQVTYGLACPSYYANITYPSSGPYKGDCPAPGMKPLWSYLAYDTIDPANTNVVFQFQTAQAVNGMCPPLASFGAPNTFKVTAGPANQQCPIGAGGGCPIDLVQAMNGGKINGPMLADCMNLTVTLNPNPQHTFTPTVNNFELRYSCPYVE